MVLVAMVGAAVDVGIKSRSAWHCGSEVEDGLDQVLLPEPNPSSHSWYVLKPPATTSLISKFPVGVLSHACSLELCCWCLPKDLHSSSQMEYPLRYSDEVDCQVNRASFPNTHTQMTSHYVCLWLYMAKSLPELQYMSVEVKTPTSAILLTSCEAKPPVSKALKLSPSSTQHLLCKDYWPPYPDMTSEVSVFTMDFNKGLLGNGTLLLSLVTSLLYLRNVQRPPSIGQNGHKNVLNRPAVSALLLHRRLQTAFSCFTPQLPRRRLPCLGRRTCFFLLDWAAF